MRNTSGMPTPIPPDPPDLIGSKDACRILGDIDRTTLTRRVKDGLIPTVGKLPGKSGALLFDRAVIEAIAARIAAGQEVADSSAAAWDWARRANAEHAEAAR